MRQIDFTEEETTLLKLLFSLSRNTVDSASRNPDKIERIIKSEKAAIKEYSNVLETNKKRVESLEPRKREKFLGYINDRLLLLDLASALPLFGEKTHLNLHLGRLPPIENVAVETHLTELTFCNLYMGASLYNSLNMSQNIEEDVEAIASGLIDAFSVYEKTRFLDGRKGFYQKSPSGRAHLAYAYEFLASRPNVFELVKTTRDYSILYGREGTHYEVKDKVLFSDEGKKTFKEVHLNSIKRYGYVCFPEPIRFLLLKFIPTEYQAQRSLDVRYA